MLHDLHGTYYRRISLGCQIFTAGDLCAPALRTAGSAASGAQCASVQMCKRPVSSGQHQYPMRLDTDTGFCSFPHLHTFTFTHFDNAPSGDKHPASFPHRILANRHGARHPVHKGWWEYGLVFDRITGLTGLRDDGRNAEGAEITRRARRGKGKGKLRLVARLR